MKKYLADLAQRTGTVFVVTLAGLAVAAEPFDMLTFNWPSALGTSGSAAVLALLVGLAARLSGDKDSAGFGR